MKKIDVLKTTGEIIVSVGVSAIVGNAIKSVTPAQVGTIKKVCIGVGSFVLCNMISDQAVKYTAQKINDAVEYVKGMADNGELN